MHIKRLVNQVRLSFEILGVIQTILWAGGGIMTIASVIAFFQNLPKIVPITLLVLGVSVTIYGVTRTIYRYRVWKSLKVIPELNDVLQKALTIHIYITKLQKNVIEENKRKNIKTKSRLRLAEKYFETLNIQKKDLPQYFNPDGTATKKLYRKMKRFNHLKDGEYFTALPLLRNYGRVLNKSKLGLKESINKSEEYDQLHNEFMASQLKLDVPDHIMSDINRLPELSYGLNSLSVGINLINEKRSWFKDIPESFDKEKEQSGFHVDTIYLKTSMWLKNKIRRAIFSDRAM